MSGSGNDHFESFNEAVRIKKSICQVLEDQFKQCQDGKLPVSGSPASSPIRVWLCPEIRGALMDTIRRRLIYESDQVLSLERELGETWAILVEFSKCVQNAKTDIEYVLAMIRTAAATLEKDFHV
ncbi:uncharacterized protein [Drosophila pseudoobscura]|uniref:Uncharacterized protein n=1 Tax=Drosophila pseudoobscura pseudoobscura TaxID=46245 RepID=A0A6I8WDD3_DROPS|nr:uncharacterized protein LOC6902040 [Drosophila pseudoobscura]XP_033240579.1 uncharacterized protein LOC6902040 [Drosophila pseudoobscura]